MTKASSIKKLSSWQGLVTVLLICWSAFGASPAKAGISGENIAIVVNADSVNSRTVANHYIQARSIPSVNVILLNDVPDTLHVSLGGFRNRILKPVLETINSRKIARQIRCIAYSADFPTAINIAAHQRRIANTEVHKYIGYLASINGLTYFYRYALSDNESYLGKRSNLYARGQFDQHFVNPFAGERATEFDKAKKQLESDDPAAAAETFKMQFDEFPTLTPLGILCAEGFAKAGDKVAATDALKRAIKGGWWSAEYLRESETLNKLLSDSELQSVLPLLSNDPTVVQGPQSFNARAGWTQCGAPIRIDQGGIPYLMSCSLAVVNRYGNSLREAVENLNRACIADRTHPKAAFWFAGGKDVRATTRFPGVGDALLYLQMLGHDASVFKPNVPTKPGNLVGLQIGSASFQYVGKPWNLVSGSISESLTSLGGDFRHNRQTKLTEYLNAGAAMSSGAVMEPYALQYKFPLPMMYGYYGAGVSAIEAYYLSVASPYQLLIVGDPVCQPFATPPAERIDFSLTRTEFPTVIMTRNEIEQDFESTRAAMMEVYVEGKLVKESPARGNMNMNLPGDLSGIVEVRVVLTGASETEPRRSFVTEIDVQGELPAPVATITQPRKPSSGAGDDGMEQGDIIVGLQCKGADSIGLVHHDKVVAAIQSDNGAATIDAAKLGGGPLRFRPVATFGKRKVLGRTIVAGE